jgi:aminopeptidase YwaD
MKKIFLSIVLISIFCSGFIFDGDKEKNPEITVSEIKSHIEFLASDKLEGRFTGSKGCEEAAKYISSEFDSYGLKPLFDKEYLQSFPFIAGLELGDNNYTQFIIDQKNVDLKVEKDFITAPFSGSKEISGDLVFAGYGISAPKLNYDDYANIDVKDKIVLVMRYSPEYDNPHSKFDEYSSFRQKATVARDKGAAGIIFVNGYFPKDDDDKFMEFRYDHGSFLKDISAVHIRRSFADELFKSQLLDLNQYQKQISETKTPASFMFKNVVVKLSTEVREIQKTSWNVAGYLEGNDPALKNEYVLVGAHFDHLGYGETGSLYRGEDNQIHNGADDNASGTTGVLELAEKFSSLKNQIKRSIIFITFSGEELGLLGSNYFVNNSNVSSDKMVTMINMDMIGKLDDEKKLIVYGTGTSTSWEELLNNKNTYNFKLTFNDEGFGPSDHSSFYGKQIPVLFFFTGTHPDYHRPSDDADKINFEGETKVVKYVYDVTSDIVNKEIKPDYVNVPRKESENVGGWKVYVGTIPDYSSNAEGFRLSGVSEGGPAQKGGLKGGDIMVKFGDKKITNIYDYVYALKEFVPGEEVDVVVLRDGKELTFHLVLGAR